MTPIAEALVILFLLVVVKSTVSLSLGRSLRMGKYRLRPVILYRQPQPEYVEEDPFSLYQEPPVQESSYPDYDEYYQEMRPDFDSLAQLYDKNDNYMQEQNAAAYLRPVSTVPPTTTTKISTYETSAMPKPTSPAHRFNRGQKEFPMLRPPTEARRSIPDSETYGVVKNFESTRRKPAEKSFADILSAELEHLKPRAH